MKCPVCQSNVSDVKDSRPTANGRVRRRRVCAAKDCQEAFTTYEVLAIDFDETLRVADPLNQARIKRIYDQLGDAISKPRKLGSS